MTIGYMAEVARAAEPHARADADREPRPRSTAMASSTCRGDPVRTAFKLYPWEWMMQRGVQRAGPGAHGRPARPDPVDRADLEDALVQQGHPAGPASRCFRRTRHVLPAWFEGEQPDGLDAFVRKPLLAREGADAQVVMDGKVVEEGPDQGYGEEGFVVQEYTDLGDYGGGARPVLGVWTVDVEPAGLGIRESDGLLTTTRRGSCRT